MQQVYTFSVYTLLNVMEDFGRDRNLEQVAARNLIGVVSAADLCARLGSSWITDGGTLSLKQVERVVDLLGLRIGEELNHGAVFTGFVSLDRLYIVNFVLQAVSLGLIGITSNSIALFCLVGFFGWISGSTMIVFISKAPRLIRQLSYMAVSCLCPRGVGG